MSLDDEQPDEPAPRNYARQISPFELVLNAYRAVFGNLKSFILTALFPFAILFAAVQLYFMPESNFGSDLSAYALALVAASQLAAGICRRDVLDALEKSLFAVQSNRAVMRVFSFLLPATVLFFVSFLGLGASEEIGSWSGVFAFIAAALVFLIFPRFSLALPALSVKWPGSLQAALKASWTWTQKRTLLMAVTFIFWMFSGWIIFFWGGSIIAPISTPLLSLTLALLISIAAFAHLTSECFMLFSGYKAQEQGHETLAAQ